MKLSIIKKNLKDVLIIIKNSSKWNENKGLFWTREKDMYIGIDNTTGECWVEEFNSLRDCKNWLLGN